MACMGLVGSSDGGSDGIRTRDLPRDRRTSTPDWTAEPKLFAEAKRVELLRAVKPRLISNQLPSPAIG